MYFFLFVKHWNIGFFLWKQTWALQGTKESESLCCHCPSQSESVVGTAYRASVKTWAPACCRVLWNIKEYFYTFCGLNLETSKGFEGKLSVLQLSVLEGI